MTVKDFAEQFGMSDSDVWDFIHNCNKNRADFIEARYNTDVLPPKVVGLMVILWEPYEDWDEEGWENVCKDHKALKKYIDSACCPLPSDAELLNTCERLGYDPERVQKDEFLRHKVNSFVLLENWGR